MSRRTANNQLTILHCRSRKLSPKRLIVLLEPNKWRGSTLHPPPTLKFVPAPLVGYTLQVDSALRLNAWHRT